jgi:hypothetical protein
MQNEILEPNSTGEADGPTTATGQTVTKNRAHNRRNDCEKHRLDRYGKTTYALVGPAEESPCCRDDEAEKRGGRYGLDPLYRWRQSLSHSSRWLPCIAWNAT